MHTAMGRMDATRKPQTIPFAQYSPAFTQARPRFERIARICRTVFYTLAVMDGLASSISGFLHLHSDDASKLFGLSHSTTSAIGFSLGAVSVVATTLVATVPLQRTAFMCHDAFKVVGEHLTSRGPLSATALQSVLRTETLCFRHPLRELVFDAPPSPAPPRARVRTRTFTSAV